MFRRKKQPNQPTNETPEEIPSVDKLNLASNQLKEYCHVLENKIADQQNEITSLKTTIKEDGVQIVFVTPPESQIKIQDLHVHIVPLDSMDGFIDDSQLGFDRIILVTKRRFDESLLFSALHLFLNDGASVVAQVAKAWFVRLGWIKLETPIPVLYAVFTEADCQHLLDCVIDANAIITLREEILARMVLNMQNNFRRYQDSLETAKAFEEKAREQELLLTKKVKTELVRLDNNTETRIDRLSPRLQPWQTILFACGWVGFLVMLGSFIAVLAL